MREMMAKILSFPNRFSWGSATSSYQIEGGVNEDGRKDSIWDVYANTPGNILNQDTGAVADDHYHLWKEDVAMMGNLGLNAYRFSLSWPRILPDGVGKVNQAGIVFYNRLIDELLKTGIEPLITLYHWDLPVALKNGWLHRSTVEAFEAFSALAARSFGDRVKRWITINEPFCAAFLGYELGIHAPGLKDISLALKASHHLLLAHGRAVTAVRAECPQAQLGIALNQGPYYTTSQTAENLETARHGDGKVNRWFMDPLYGRHYPLDMLRDFVKSGALLSVEPDFILSGDMEKIAEPTDFLAINYYTRTLVSSNPAERELQQNERTDMGWEIYPYGLYETLCRAHFTYKPKEIIIAENGASFADSPDAEGVVRDHRRTAYLQSHLRMVHKAIEAGVPVTGYFVWSLLDNFEWGSGFSERFGIVYVDFSTLKRTPKESAFWYSQVAKYNGFEG